MPCETRTGDEVFMPDPVFRTENLDAWRALLSEDRERASALYFETILPDLVSFTIDLEAHRGIDMPCDTLISLMGLSPETTVLAAAILKPRRVVTIRSRGFTSSFDRAARFMIERGLVTFSGLVHEEVSPTDPFGVYEAIRRNVIGREGEAAVVDVTGGKKVMSASATLAASELGLPVCYIDGEYDPEMRRPILGSERLIVLPNPSTYRAEISRKEALTVYESRDYPAAILAFQRSRDLQPRSAQFEDFATAICRAYAALADLDWNTLRLHVDGARTLLEKPSVAHVLGRLRTASAHFSALAEVASGGSLALLATLLELSRQYRARGRHDFSCLLAYRSLEGFVQFGLQRLAGGDFDASKPNYAKLGNPDELTERFLALAKELGHQGIDALPKKLSLVDGFMLLGLLDRVHERLTPKQTLPKAVLGLRSVAQLRNGSILAHGKQNLSETDSKRLLFEADRLGRAVLGTEFQALEVLLENLKPLPLRELAPP
jgi:hypothetical protein